MNNYDAAVKQRWGGTEAYQEYEQKAKYLLWKGQVFND